MGHPLIYLDNAATSWPKPPSVAAAMADFLTSKAGNPGRGGHFMARAAAEVVEDCRGALATLISAPCADRVVLTHGCTDSANLAIHGRLLQLRRDTSSRARPHVVMSAVEHNAVSRTLHCYERDGLIDLTIVGCDREGFVNPADMLRACTRGTVLICLSHASNACGTIQPISEVGASFKKNAPEALFFVDAAQTAGHIDIDVQRDNIDLLALAGHKGLRGPTGTGALYVGPRAFSDDPDGPRLTCPRTGGTGAIARGLDMPTELPDALEAGTSNAVGFAGLLAAIREHKDAHFTRELDLAMQIVTGLNEIPGITVYGRRTRNGRTSVVMFNVTGIPAREVGAILDEKHNICVRGGIHCAPLLHQQIGTGDLGAVRASPGPLTTDAEITQFLGAVRSLTLGRKSVSSSEPVTARL